MCTSHSIFVCACLLSIAACGKNAPGALSDQDVAAIHAVGDKYVDTALAGDWDRWGATIAEDAVFIPPTGAPLTGREAIVAWGRALPDVVEFTAPLGEVHGAGDFAQASGQYAYSVSQADGSTVKEQGVFIDMFRKGPDGAWRFSRAMWRPTIDAPSSATGAHASAQEELIKLEHAWGEAAVKRDESFLNQLFAEEYVFTAPDGSIADKKTDIAAIVSGKVRYESFELSDVQARVYGDTAVVRGRNRLKGRAQGADIGGEYRFTDVFVKRDGRWQVAASHAGAASKDK